MDVRANRMYIEGFEQHPREIWAFFKFEILINNKDGEL